MRAALTRFIGKGRLEFLFDGIFAIAMTILVLELKVPELQDRHSVSELWNGIVEHGATFFSYLLSFVMLGMLWFRHNEQFHHVTKVSLGMLMLQLAQLALAAFFPFCAALLGRYPTNHLSQAIYIGCVMLYMWCAAFHWIRAHRLGVLGGEIDAAKYLEVRKRNLMGAGVLTVMFVAYGVQVLGL
ncbi:MAG TPA: TMEM175 family protein [Bacteroidota bacterium]|nr:TMEM175 family protein [Bacteroidota bacterium]